MERCVYLLILLPQLIDANYALYKVTAFNFIERSILYQIHFKNQHYYFMNGVTNEAIIPMDIIVDDSQTNSFEKKLMGNNIQFSRFSQDVTNYTEGNEKFYDWDAVNSWVNEHVTKHAELKKIVIAKTFEKRDVFILKLASEKKKVAVFIMGGEIGRDWLTPAIILNLIKELLEKKDLRQLRDYYDFYFLPFMNPDGYDYSRNVNRFWAKNRKIFIPKIDCSKNYTAEGVNLNRNWHFAKSSYNVIDQECNAVYIGQWPLSEEETLSLSYALNNLALNLMAFINLKGFNRLITIPYGNEAVSVNHDIMMDLITMASDKVKENYNVTYYVGKTEKYIYNSSGNVADWVKKMLNIPIVYTIYLKHDTVLPKFQNVKTLTRELNTILNETLTMARDIYGPLFNGSYKIVVGAKKTVLCIIIITLNYIHGLYCCNCVLYYKF